MERLIKDFNLNCGFQCSECFICDFKSDAIKKLAYFEDMQEQGRLLELPCKAGDTIFLLDVDCTTGLINKDEEITHIFVESITITEPYWCINREVEFELSDFGKFIFLTRAEAEAALEKLRADT